MRRRLASCVSVLLSCLLCAAQSVPPEGTGAASPTFYTLNTQDGLSNDNVLQVMQLPDGRILSIAETSIDLYDGILFSHIPRSNAERRPLPGYDGQTHLYLDGEERLWVKGWRHVACYDLKRLRPLSPAEALLPDSLQDFYIDSEGRQWLVFPHSVRSSEVALQAFASGVRRVPVPQDIDCMDGRVYVFYDTGEVGGFDASSGRLLTTSAAYRPDEAPAYEITSLVVQGDDRCFYQLRTGFGGGVFLRYSPADGSWQRLLTANHLLHSLVVLPSGLAYITLPDGYMEYDLRTHERRHHDALRLPDGTQLTTGINAFCHDRTGGIWLGTYHEGLLYTSPLSGVFNTQPLDIPVRPLLSSIFLQGEHVEQDSLYGGRVLTTVATPYVRHLTLRHDQNSVAFQFSTMNYVRPRATRYRYRLSNARSEGTWHTVVADSASSGFVDNRGALYLPFAELSPGRYRLCVMASTRPGHWDEAEAVTLTFDVLPPWWRTWWAYGLAGLACLGGLVALTALYVRRKRRQMERQHREAMLLLRIQNLVEQVNQYEQAASRVVLSEDHEHAEPIADEQTLSPQDLDFMQRATALVEQHLSDPQYNVEQLAADLCMERTGLYRRLTALMDQSPVVFIRSIRLQRAAALLKEGGHSITEVSELTGFGTVGYFGKCFQREFGCKPSEYR